MRTLGSSTDTTSDLRVDLALRSYRWHSMSELRCRNKAAADRRAPADGRASWDREGSGWIAPTLIENMVLRDVTERVPPRRDRSRGMLRALHRAEEYAHERSGEQRRIPDAIPAVNATREDLGLPIRSMASTWCGDLGREVEGSRVFPEFPRNGGALAERLQQRSSADDQAGRRVTDREKGGPVISSAPEGSGRTRAGGCGAAGRLRRGACSAEVREWTRLTRCCRPRRSTSAGERIPPGAARTAQEQVRMPPSRLSAA